jgi:hypothetical protein
MLGGQSRSGDADWVEVDRISVPVLTLQELVVIGTLFVLGQEGVLPAFFGG